MKQPPDAIQIITRSPDRGEAIRRMLLLRGFDEIRCLSLEAPAQEEPSLHGAPPDQPPRERAEARALENVSALLRRRPPALAVIETDGDRHVLENLFQALPSDVKSIVLAETFDEALFVQCHDAGARDFLVSPVSDAYLISRVIRALHEHRLEQQLRQREEILVDMGVLSPQSGVFSTSYLIKRLQKLTEEQSSIHAPDPLSLILVRLDGGDAAWPEPEWRLVRTEAARILKECARGLDVVGEYLVDKFALILPRTGRRGARALAARLSKRLSELSPASAPDEASRLRIGIGIAEYEGCRHYEELLARALAHLQTGDALTPAAAARFEV
jgi:PleD family two-component response regulator